VFDMLWYQGLTQAEAAALLQVSERTLQRRWRAACERLHAALDGELHS
jgi:DNA-directed RNA polymerase specialized sigma24 family protein